MLHSLLYYSKARNPIDAPTIAQAIAAGARPRNAERGIGGALIVIDGWFVQYLEGQQQSIDQLMAKIERDPRHHLLQIVARGPTASRLYLGWGLEVLLDPHDDSLARQRFEAMVRCAAAGATANAAFSHFLTPPPKSRGSYAA